MRNWRGGCFYRFIFLAIIATYATMREVPHRKCAYLCWIVELLLLCLMVAMQPCVDPVSKMPSAGWGLPQASGLPACWDTRRQQMCHPQKHSSRWRKLTFWRTPTAQFLRNNCKNQTWKQLPPPKHWIAIFLKFANFQIKNSRGFVNVPLFHSCFYFPQCTRIK